MDITYTAAGRFTGSLAADSCSAARRPWTSGGEPIGYDPVLADPSLPHQIVLLLPSVAGLHSKIAVSCNCLAPAKGAGAGRGRPRELIDARLEFPVADALAAYRSWHAERGMTA
jgi:hypothetical protein